MPIIHQLLNIDTKPGINISNITPLIQDFIDTTSINNGQVLVFSRHTTTALAINEDEVRLLEDIKVFLRKLAPESDHYLHTALPAAMRYTLKAESYDSRGVRGKLYRIIAGIAVMTCI